VNTPQGSADAASRWIAESARWIENKYQPTLNLVYLPHLDYNLQRQGPYEAAGADCVAPADGAVRTPRPVNPAIHRDLQQIDAIVGDLISFFRSRSIQVLLLSEYGITNVDSPIHLNRLFREKGWLTVKDELGLEVLDCGASKVFAVADHQVAHIYLNDRALEKEVMALLENTPGVTGVMGEEGRKEMGINHPRAGDLIAVASERAWFTYYYWLDDAKAPDFARCVDIHRKPGYDPVELFLDPTIPAVKLKILGRLLQKKLGFRMLMDVIPLDATLVKGSHGCRPANPADWPVLITDQSSLLTRLQTEPTAVYQIIRKLVAEATES
jgi:predicted AlkP superfamily pyrophosphatase or phosphodiesterase